MGIAIGIDLGTSNSTVAVYRRGRVESIPIDGKKVMPSVVSYKEDGQVLVGNSAKARLYIDPANSISSSKRFMGDPDKVYQVRNQRVTPVEVARRILEKIRVESSKYLGQEVTEAVITIPAYFTDAQREATKKAGELAGLKVLRLLPEPTAAAIAYGLDKERNQIIMVYDLGGGTFDVSILRVESNSFRVIAVDGDSMLGGDDFDEVLIQYVLDRNGIRTGLHRNADGSSSLQRIKEAVEEAKKELSESEFADISIPDVFGQHIDEEVDLQTFTGLVQPLLQKTINKLQEVLASAELTKRDISRVILVGGSTRMKAVREIVSAQIKQPFIADNVDEIVAQGAAIMAANLSVPDIDNTPIEVEDVTAHSLGIDMLMDGNLEVVHLIRKNTVIPCKGAVIGTTIRPKQAAIVMGVFRTESIVPREADKLGELELPVRVREQRVPAVALFELDSDGILTFSSAELADDSKLVYAFMNGEGVDLDLLEDLIEDGEIRLKRVTIDTKKEERRV